MDPISNQMFSHDYPKFVYQNPDVLIVPPGPTAFKPFEIKGPEKSKKTKKDLDKKKQGDKKGFIK